MRYAARFFASLTPDTVTAAAAARTASAAFLSSFVMDLSFPGQALISVHTVPGQSLISVHTVPGQGLISVYAVPD